MLSADFQRQPSFLVTTMHISANTFCWWSRPIRNNKKYQQLWDFYRAYNKINIRDVIAHNYWRRFYSTCIQPVASWYPAIGVISQCYCREFADYHAEAEPTIVGGGRTGIRPKLTWCASKSSLRPIPWLQGVNGVKFGRTLFNVLNALLYPVFTIFYVVILSRMLYTYGLNHIWYYPFFRLWGI